MNEIGVPGGKDVPLSGFTVTSMSASVHATPLALPDGLAELDGLELVEALGVLDGDG